MAAATPTTGAVPVTTSVPVTTTAIQSRPTTSLSYSTVSGSVTTTALQQPCRVTDQRATPVMTTKITEVKQLTKDDEIEYHRLRAARLEDERDRAFKMLKEEKETLSVVKDQWAQDQDELRFRREQTQEFLRQRETDAIKLEELRRLQDEQKKLKENAEFMEAKLLTFCQTNPEVVKDLSMAEFMRGEVNECIGRKFSPETVKKIHERAKKIDEAMTADNAKEIENALTNWQQALNVATSASDVDRASIAIQMQRNLSRTWDKRVEKKSFWKFLDTETTTFGKAEKIASKLNVGVVLHGINSLINAKNSSDVMICLISVCESYGLYWNSISKVAPKALALCVMGVTSLAKSAGKAPGLEHEADDEVAMTTTLEGFLKSIGEKMPVALPKNLIPLVSAIGPILLLGLSATTITEPGTKVGKVIHQIAQSVKDTSTLTDCAAKVHEACKTGLTMAFDNESLHTREKLLKDLSELEKEVQEFKTDIEVRKMRAQGKFQLVKGFRKRFENCKETYDLMCASKENMIDARFYVARLSTLLPDITRHIEQMVSTSATRQEPACIWLYGPPRSGKSTSVKQIIKQLSAFEGRPLTSYFRNSNDKYVSGYNQQDVYVYDDFASATEAEDVHEFLMAKSSNAYNLNMSELDDKGMPFTSTYIIICSNAAGILTCDKVQHPDAIDERRDILMCVQSTEAHLPLEQRTFADGTQLNIRMKPRRSATQNYDSYGDKPYTISQIAWALFDTQRKYRKAYDKWLEENSNVEIMPGVASGDDIAPPAVEKAVSAEDLARVRVPDELRKPVDMAREVRRQKMIDAHRSKQDDGQDAQAGRVDMLADQFHWYRENAPQFRGARGKRGLKRNSLERQANSDDEFDAEDFCAAQDTQKTTDADDVTKITFSRGRKSYVLVGDTGTGKTTFIRELKTECDKLGIKLSVSDEFTKDPALAQRTLKQVWKIRDNETRPFVLTTNVTTWDKLNVAGYDTAAVRNRVIVFKFKRRWSSRTGPATIFERQEWNDKTSKTEPTSKAQMIAEICQIPDKEEVVVASSLQIPKWAGPLPDKKFFFRLTPEEFKEAGVCKLLKMTFSGDVKSLDPSVSPMDLKVLVPTACFLKVAPDEFIAKVNEAEIDVDEFAPFSLCGINHTTVVTRVGGKLRMYKANEFSETEVTQLLTELDKAAKLDKNVSTTEKNMVFEVLDGIFFFIKTGLCLGFGISAITQSVMAKMKKPTLTQEGKYKRIPIGDEVTDYQEIYDSEKCCKSIIKVRGRKKMDYCYMCSSSECHHCVEWESYDGKAKADTVKHEITRAQEASAAHLSHAGVLPTEQPKKYLQIPIAPPPAVVKPPEVKPYMPEQQATEHEAVFDPAANDLVPAIRRNTIFVGDKNVGFKQRAFMVGGHIGVTNMHSLSGKVIGEQFPVYYGNVQSMATIVQLIPKMDICIFRLQPSDNQFPDLRKHIVSKDDINHYNGQFAWMVVVSPDQAATIINIVLEDETEMLVKSEKQQGLAYNGHRVGVSYTGVNTTKGYCGSVVLMLNTKKPRKICAIHAAADNVTGLGSTLYVEMFEKCFQTGAQEKEQQALGTDESITILPHQLIIPLEEPVFVGQYTVYGYTGNPDTGEIIYQRRSEKTHLWDSPLAFGEKAMEPSVLSAKDTRMKTGIDPYVEATGKYNRIYPDIDIKLLDDCVDQIAEYYADAVLESGQVVRVLTKTEAINGAGWLAKSNPMIRDSSAGYPWKVLHPGMKKGDYFTFDEKLKIWKIRPDGIGRELHHAMDAIERFAREGKRTAAVNVASLKDEPRKLAKIEEGATRAFWAAPIDKTLLDRRYFHAACAAMEHICDKIPCKVGINPIGMGFHRLYRYHSKISCVGFDLDAKNWDSSLHPEIVRRLPIIFNRIYQKCDPNWCEQDDTVRTTLGHYVDRALVLIGECMTMLPGGNNSGQTNTSQFNSLANDVILFYIWRKLAEAAGIRGMGTVDQLRKHVAASFYGDDLMITVSLWVRRWFRPDLYIAEGAKLGVEFTAAAKDGKEVSWSELKDMEFLKRNFKQVQYANGEIGPYFTGALQESSFHHMLDICDADRAHHYWKDQGEVLYNTESIRATCLTAQHEASQHGLVYFHSMKMHLQRRCQEYGITGVTWLSYQSCLNMTWDLVGYDDDLSIENRPSCLKHERIIDGQHELIHVVQQTRHQTEPSKKKRKLERQANEEMAGKSMPATTGERGAPQMETTGEEHHSTTMDGMQNVARGNTGVIYPATGSYGMLPGPIYEKNIAIGNITWSTTQNAGTLLAEKPVAPFGSNQYVQYFSAPWNAWAGGMEYSLLIAATGFNGGKLIMAVLPPNLKPNQVQGISNITVFPHRIVDVKEANALQHTAYDERNILFHWRNETERERDAIGGYFCIWVLSPLINSSGTPGQVNMVLFSRPDASFRVSQLMPLNTLDEAPGMIVNAGEMLPSPDEVTFDPYVGDPIQNVVVETPVPEITMGEYGAKKGDGTDVARPYEYWGRQPLFIVNHELQPDVNDSQLRLWPDTTSKKDLSRPLDISVVAHANTGQPGTGYTQATWYQQTTVETPDYSNQGYLYSQNQGSVGQTYGPVNMTALNQGTIPLPNPGLPGNYVLSVNPMEWKTTVTADPDYDFRFYPLNGESVVYFQSQQLVPNQPGNVINALQCVKTIDYLRKNPKLLRQGQALLFQVFDVKTALPIGYLKFYFEGVFTTNPSSTVINAPINQLKFEPLQIIDATEFIPSNPAVTMNGMLVESSRAIASMAQQK